MFYFYLPMKSKFAYAFLMLIVLWQLPFVGLCAVNELPKIVSFSELPTFKRIEFNVRNEFSYSPSLGGGWGEVFMANGSLHNDSIHRLNFRYHDKERGIKPFIAPAALITAGTILHFSTNAKENFQEWVQKNFSYSGHADDYIQYAPLVVVYGLNAVGVKGKNNFGNRSAIVVKSLLINDIMVSSLKTWSNSTRPNGNPRSFPSGHTSVAFALAHFMHKEYSERSVWYSIGAYSCAATVGFMRVAKNAHWISDVVAGAGFGILSTELVYLTHQYKWDNEHIKNFDIFPWSNRKQSGLTMVYTF
jgi:membrane-associated phospholipid phosphatase